MRQKTFGQRLRELRINNKDYISLRDFARKVGLSAAYLSRIENDKESPPSEGIIEKLAKGLAVDKYELFSYAGKVPTEFLETFKRNPKRVALFLRRANEVGLATDNEWRQLEKEVLRIKRTTDK